MRCCSRCSATQAMSVPPSERTRPAARSRRVSGCTVVENPYTGQRTMAAESLSACSSTGNHAAIDPETSRYTATCPARCSVPSRVSPLQSNGVAPSRRCNCARRSPPCGSGVSDGTVTVSGSHGPLSAPFAVRASSARIACRAAACRRSGFRTHSSGPPSSVPPRRSTIGQRATMRRTSPYRSASACSGSPVVDSGRWSPSSRCPSAAGSMATPSSSAKSSVVVAPASS